MEKLKIGMVGLGYIAQSTYLPLLANHANVEFVGAFSPNADEAKKLCAQYRIDYYTDLTSLIDMVDALFVHSATSSHYEVVKAALLKGKAVYVDKPLAAELEQATELVELADKQKTPLMVGFNRRFAPAYIDLKMRLDKPAFIHVEKHRIDEVGHDLAFTLLDDYIHIIDTLYWLADGQFDNATQYLQVNAAGELIFGQSRYQNNDGVYLASMHRASGTSLEKISVIQKNTCMEVVDMLQLQTVDHDTRIMAPVNLRITAPARRGFDNAVNHFIESVLGATTPIISGYDAIAAQTIIENIIADYRKQQK
ncbi:Gfo/Idh/MocA family protein [Culicoidibacter larvae]|uniref:Gfo/Idh/MocA family oxidoreductase n=1 Tax=Culicoidibacter larvae TaxID=2579976 RepID=A0A5R8QCE4_9FIRM|nr:Gfo/Idh/MocA family oxidoreductase [Culicoidibacter larvae]TLG74239.1 Gfo/Idh/MocA family oxidoreductase [Culicoidibacter larvae]